MPEFVELKCDDISFFVIYDIFFEHCFHIHDIALRKPEDYTSNTPDIDTINFDILFIDEIEKYIKDKHNYCSVITIRVIYEPMPHISLSRLRKSFLYNNTKVLNAFVKSGFFFEGHEFEGSDYIDMDFQMFLTKNL